jgi:hypothetical protein
MGCGEAGIFLSFLVYLLFLTNRRIRWAQLIDLLNSKNRSVPDRGIHFLVNSGTYGHRAQRGGNVRLRRCLPAWSVGRKFATRIRIWNIHISVRFGQFISTGLCRGSGQTRSIPLLHQVFTRPLEMMNEYKAEIFQSSPLIIHYDGS